MEQDRTFDPFNDLPSGPPDGFFFERTTAQVMSYGIVICADNGYEVYVMSYRA